MNFGKRLRAAVSAGALTLMLAIPFGASAATLDVAGGIWSTAVPGGTASGIGTNQILWGKPAKKYQSGYRFDGRSPLPAVIPVDSSPFQVGTFTHMNYPIASGTSITQATLDLSLDLTIDGVNFDDILFSVVFDHNETPNVGGPPASDDIVTIADTGGAVLLNANGQDYILEILGFQIGGQIVDTFMTQENMTNKAHLVGAIHTKAAVPEPSTYLLMGSLLAFAYAMQRRKQTQLS